MPLQFPFKLSGNTNLLWSQVTNNEWKSMLPEHWTDKGFHFYKRIRKRGPEAGINTPSDLNSEMNNGRVAHDHGDRYKVTTNIVNSDGKHFTIFYDYDDQKELCELVTCSYE